MPDSTQSLSADDIATLDSASNNEYSSSFDSPNLTAAQIAALKALVAWIRSHPG